MNRHDVVALVGAPGTGKSSAMMRRAALRPRVIVVDPEGAIKTMERCGVREAVSLIQGEDPHFHRVVDTTAYNVPPSDIISLLMTAAWDSAQETGFRHVTIAVDEWFSAYASKGEGRSPVCPRTLDVLLRGRKHGVSVIIAAIGLTHLHPNVRRCLSSLNLYRQPNAADRKIAREYLETSTEAEKLRTLPNFNFASINFSTGETVWRDEKKR